MKKSLLLLAMAVSLFIIPIALAENPADSAKADPNAKAEMKSYIRVLKPTPTQYNMEIAIREFVPKSGKGPKIWLAGAIHIGDMSYYQQVQNFLDAQPLVLFEGVGAGVNLATPASRLDHTRQSIGFLAAVAEIIKADTGSYPANLVSIRTYIAKNRVDLSGKFRRSLVDGWGNKIQYAVTDGKLDIKSLGKDNAPGGTDENKDRSLKGNLTQAQIDSLAGAKSSPVHQLAEALGLVHQHAGVNYDRDHFVNSDMSFEEIERRAGNDPKLKQLKGMIGSGGGMNFNAAMVKMLIGLIKSNNQLKGMVKLMMMEMFGGMKQMPQLPGGGNLMKVIVEDRNQVVIDDLKKLIVDKTPAKSIGVFYGAAHMPGIQKTLESDMGYKPGKVIWVPAFGFDTQKSGMSPQMVNMLRQMLKMQMQKMQQMNKRNAA